MKDFKHILNSFFPEPASFTSTQRPPPPWFPLESNHNSWSNINKHLAKASINGTEGASDGHAKSLELDEENQLGQQRSHEDLLSNPGDESKSGTKNKLGLKSGTPRVIEVRVPKPFNFDQGHRQKKPNPHLPITIPLTTTTSRTPLPQTPEVTKEAAAENGEQMEGEVDGRGEDVHVMVNFTQFCPPATARGLFWNWTRAVSVLTCLFSNVYLAADEY